MTKFSFSELCTGCGTCSFVCPKNLIEMDSGHPHMSEENCLRCNSCGQCVAYCPVGAAHQTLDEGKELERTVPINTSQISFIDIFLKQRRSYRTFSNSRPINQKVIEEILDVANYAPTGGNNRPIRWIVLSNREKTKQLADLVANWLDGECRNHPVLSKRYAIDSIISRVRKGKDVIFRGAPCVVLTIGPKGQTWGDVDSGIALTYFNLAAEARNIGCCFGGYATNAAKYDPKTREFLHLKDNEDCYCCLFFGYKTINARRIPSRPDAPTSFI